MRAVKLTVEHDNIALLDALLAQGTSECLNLLQDLPVGMPLLRLGDGAVVVDGDLITTAGQDVPVDAVVAG